MASAKPKKKPRHDEPERVQASRLKAKPAWTSLAIGPFIGDVIDQYTTEHLHRRKRFAYVVQRTLNLFLMSTGMTEAFPMTHITKARCLAFKQTLLNGVPGKRKVKPITMSYHIQTLKHFTKWCVANDYLQVDPMLSVSLPVRLVESNRVRKLAFTDEDLTKIFQAMGPYRNHENPMRVEWFWMVFLLVFSGARASEIKQLRRCDVYQDGGIWCLRITDEGPRQALKNRVSHRIIPLHSSVLKLGFIEWMQAQPDGVVFGADGDLFPRLHQYEIHKTSEWFRQLLKSVGINTPAKTQHSLRHTMAVRLERARVHYSIMRRSLGHAIGKSVEDRTYLSSLEYSAQELSEALETIQMPPID